MRQGITTRYIGPTNTKGGRIKATARKASSLGKEMALTLPYDYSGTTTVHAKTAKALAEKLGWSGLWVAGGKPEEDGNMYVNVGLSGKPEAEAMMDALGRAWEGEDWFYVAPKA